MEFKQIDPPFSENTSNTHFVKLFREDSEFNWLITYDEFHHSTERPDSKQYLKSPIFPTDSNANFKWSLKLYPFERENTCETMYSAIYLFLQNDGSISRNVHVVALITLETKNDIIVDDIKFTFVDNSIGFGICRFMETSTLESDLYLGPITINIKVSATDEGNSWNSRKSMAENSLIENYANLLKNEVQSDVTICTNDAEIKAHSVILSAQSKVFADMLVNNAKENFDGRIKIDDCSGELMKALLEFIYCSKVKFHDVDEAVNLLKASEKFELLDLKMLCAEYLASVANKSNACCLLLVAEVHDLPELKEKMLEYMRENKRKFINPDTYEEILEKKPRLLADISANFAKEK